MRIYIILKIAVLAFFSTSAYGYINVHPYRIYLDTERGILEEEIILYNKTTSQLRYKISIRDERLKEVISFYPQVITLKPGEERSVRLKLEKSWENLEKVEYSSEILIEQLRVPVRNLKGEFIQSEGIEVYPKIKIPLKLYFGSEKIAVKVIGDTGLRNISGREINLEIFYKEDRKNREKLEFIKSLRVSQGESADLKEIFREYRERNRKRGDVTLKDIVILEKFSGKKVERVDI